MRARIGVAVMAVLLVLYIVLVGRRAALLISDPQPIAVAMGIALLVLPVLAVWALGRELWFGLGAERLGKRLEREGGLPVEEVSTLPSGRIVRDDADAVFPAYRADVEANPEDWRAWYRLGLAYDGAGDRRRARSAVRQAIRLETAERRRSAF